MKAIFTAPDFAHSPRDFFCTLVVTGLVLLSPGAFASTVKKAPTPASIKKADLQKQANEKLAKDIIKLGSAPDLRVGQNPDAPARPGEINANDKNTSLSNTTYHSYVVSTCESWAGEDRILCEKYLPAYVTPHTKDKSLVEDFIGKKHREREQTPPTSSGGEIQYSIFNITMKDDSDLIVQGEGKMSFDGIASIKLQDEVRQGTEQIGYKTAANLLRSTYDEDAKRTSPVEQIAPDPEKARYATGVWTRMFRNRLVDIIGGISASQKGVEVVQGSDLPDCSSYAASVMNQQDEVFKEGRRLGNQFTLDPETLASSLEERVKRCEALKQASVYMKNPRVDGDQITEGTEEEERIDAKLARANLAAIDYGGATVDELSAVAGTQINGEEAMGRRGEWDREAKEVAEVTESNAKTIRAFNREVEKAAEAMKGVAARTSNVVDISEQIKSNKIPDRINLVELNGLTPQMKGELGKEGLPSAISSSVQRTPANTVEATPAELTVTQLQ